MLLSLHFLAISMSVVAAATDGVPLAVAPVVISAALRSLHKHTRKTVAALEHGATIWECVGQSQQDRFVLKLGKFSSVIREPPGDALLVLREALRFLVGVLKPCAAALAKCLGDGEPIRQALQNLQHTVAQLSSFIEVGKIDSGHCPFTGKEQTTIGGTDVRKELANLATGGWAEAGKQPTRLGKALGRLLRKVQAADGKPPPGTHPVNWEMREMMYGTPKLEL